MGPTLLDINSPISIRAQWARQHAIYGIKEAWNKLLGLRLATEEILNKLNCHLLLNVGLSQGYIVPWGKMNTLDWNNIRGRLVTADGKLPERWKLEQVAHEAILQIIQAGHSCEEMAAQGRRNISDAPIADDAEEALKYHFFTYVMEVAKSVATRIREVEFLLESGYETIEEHDPIA
ncbi:hypothetical protein QBC43DRAFT_337014 [Cladorrhinum sp. PSN259]|nr:hypothetical protein QBC43DRAFT_337014 [Cladorrhinum sp. PSN259]